MSADDPYGIKALQKQLEELYQTDVKRNLNDRHVVELVLQLVREGELDIYFSTDGKEYITPKQLDHDIRQLIESMGGRAQLVDLPSHLNVDLKAVEERVYDLVKRSRGKISLTQEGEIISASYLSLVAKEINEAVRQHGQIGFEALARRVSLPVSMIATIVDEHLGSVIQNCRLDNGVLYQDSVRERYKAIIRGTLRGATTPVSVDTIIRRYDLQPDIAVGCFEELLSDNESIKGEIERSKKGDRQQTFIPAFYRAAREQWISSFFRSNGFITNAEMEKLGVRDRTALSFFEKPPLFLESCVVSESLVAMIDGEILAAIQSSQPIDAASLINFSSAITKRDTLLLIQQCSGLEAALKSNPPSALLLEDTLVVPNSFCDSFLLKYEQYAVKNPKSVPASVLDDAASRARRNAALVAECVLLLKEWYPDTFSTTPSLIEPVANQLRPDMDRIRIRLDKSRFKESIGGHMMAKDRGKAFQDKFDYIYLNIFFFNLCLQDASADAAAKKELDKYLCSTLGSDLVDHIIIQLAVENMIPLPDPNVTNLSAEQREDVFKLLPGELRRSVQSIVAASQKGAAILIEEISRQGDCLELQIKEQEPVKVRKSLVSHHKALIVQQINKIISSDMSEANLNSLYRLAVSLLFLVEHSSLLYSSTKTLAVMANACKDDVAKDLIASVSSANPAEMKETVVQLAQRALQLAEPKPKTTKTKPRKI